MIGARLTSSKCIIHLKLKIKTPERLQWRHSGVFIVNFEQISRIVLMFRILTFLNLDFKQVNAGRVLGFSVLLVDV